MKIGIYVSSFDSSVEADVSAGILADALSRKHQTELICAPDSTSPETFRVLCDSSLKQVMFRTIPGPPQRIMDPGAPERRYQALRAWSDELTRPYDLFVNFSDGIPIYCSAPRGVVVIQFVRDFIPSLYRTFWHEHLASYQLKLSNSYYTRFWTRMFWDTDCPVVHPPVPMQATRTPKEDLILAIGPFGSSRPGKQLELITAFKEFKTRMPTWSFSVVGEVGKQYDSRKYLETVCDLAADSGVTVVANPSIEQQRDLISRAKLFWLAAGLGEDLDFQPEKAIPFSVPLVEAMSGGCMPLVTNTGGLSEIVLHGENGYFWTDTAQLIDPSVELARNEPLRFELAKSAAKRAKHFRPERFTNRFLRQLERAFGYRFQSSTFKFWERWEVRRSGKSHL